MERYYWERMNAGLNPCVIFDRTKESAWRQHLAVARTDYEAADICNALNLQLAAKKAAEKGDGDALHP